MLAPLHLIQPGLLVPPATAYVLTADASGMSISGTSAGLNLGSVVQASAGAVAITGTSANLNKGSLVSAQLEAIPISGTAANLNKGLSLTVQSGAVPVTGTTASLNKSSLVGAQSGAIPVTGTAAGLNIGYLVTALTASIPITGTDVSMSRGAAPPVAVQFQNFMNSDVSVVGVVKKTLASNAFEDRAVARSVNSYTTGRFTFRVTGDDTFAGLAWLDGVFPTQQQGFKQNKDAGTGQHYIDILNGSQGVIKRVFITDGDLIEIVLGSINVQWLINGVVQATRPRDPLLAGAVYLAADIRVAQNDQVYDVTSVSIGAEVILTMSAGAVSLTGTDAHLWASQPLVAQTGVTPITGTNAGLNHSYLVTAQSATMSVTGSPAGLNVGFVLLSQLGTIPVTGSGADLLKSSVLTATFGTVDIVGTNVFMSKGQRLTALEGAVSIDSVDASLQKSSLVVASSGAIPVIGQSVNFLRQFVATMTPSNVPVLGKTVILTWNTYPFFPSPGMVPVTGKQAVLIRFARLRAETSRIEIIGTDATLIGVAPDLFSTEMIEIPLRSLRHHI
jgi:hypothetical protein